MIRSKGLKKLVWFQ